MLQLTPLRFRLASSMLIYLYTQQTQSADDN